MFPFRFFAWLAVVLLVFVSVSAALPQDDAVAKQLAVQSAMTRARALLGEMNAQKAVDVLEEQLPKVNGNPQYLVLLREAYRANIRDLYLKGQPVEAKRYLERLTILDPGAAKDTALRPQIDVAPRKFEQDPPKQTGLQFPSFKGFPNPFAKKEEPKAAQPMQELVARAVPEGPNQDDPFDKKYQRETPIDASKSIQARELLSRGLNEFNLKHYPEAKQCFEEAYRADQTTLSTSREPWAYCILENVARTMEQPAAKFAELQKQVEGAIEMAPGKVMAEGQRLQQELERRAKSSAAPTVVASVSNVKHWGQNKEGWQVAETKHFRIFHKQNNEFAERVAQIAENTRVAMYRKWFSTDGIEWDPICELIMHPNVSSYTHMTDAPNNSPGHSRIEADRGPSKRVISRRMDLRCDIPTVMDCVLPHEATHVVLAGMFGPHHVPRWADEGIAVLSEPKEKIDAHRRNLLKHHQEGLLFGLKELMEMENYPQPRRIGAFYAQSVMLADFLAQQKGPKVLPEFVKDGLRQGYETSLQKHYGMTFTQLEQQWRQQVIEQRERVAAQ